MPHGNKSTAKVCHCPNLLFTFSLAFDTAAFPPWACLSSSPAVYSLGYSRPADTATTFSQLPNGTVTARVADGQGSSPHPAVTATLPPFPQPQAVRDFVGVDLSLGRSAVERREDWSACPDAFRIWHPLCFNKSVACPSECPTFKKKN